MKFARHYRAEFWNAAQHIYPVNDELDHELTGQCNCSPVINVDVDPGIVIHQLVQETSP